MIKTFRGILEDGEQQRIRLSTKKGKIGYQIVNFQIFPSQPGTNDTEAVVQIFKIKQATVPTGSATVNFSDGNLLGAALYQDGNQVQYNDSVLIIFEQEIFNHDIYVTHTNQEASSATNYYIELETINMSDNAAAVATLRDIRLNPQVGA